MEFEYFVYGNGAFFWQVMNAVVRATSHASGFQTVMTATVLLGFICCIAYIAFSMRWEVFGSWFFGIVLLWFGFFVPTTSLTITEVQHVAGMPPITKIDNVPLGLAFSMHTVNMMGRYFTRNFEKNLTLPDNSSYSKNGMVFGARLYSDLRAMHINNDYLTQDWTSFMRDCAFYDMALYHRYTPNEMIHSTDILTLLGNTNQALFTTLGSSYDVDTRVISARAEKQPASCDVAYTYLKLATLQDTTQSANGLVKKLNHTSLDAGVLALDTAKATLFSEISTFRAAFYQGAARTALQTINQHAMINLMRESEYQNASYFNDQGKMNLAISVAQAEAQSLQSMRTQGGYAATYIPILHNIIEMILIILFPIVLILAALSILGAWKVIMGWVMALLWIQLWPPLMTLLNFIVVLHTKDSVTGILGGSGGAIDATLGNSTEVYNAFASGQALAGSLMWSIPLIAGFLVKIAQMSFEGLASAGTKTAQGSAESTGSSTGSGNFNMGNSSVNNESANKWSTGAEYTNPAPMRIHNPYGDTMLNMGGRDGSSSAGGANAMLNWARSEQGQKVRAQQLATQTQQSSALSHSLSSTLGEGSDYSKLVSHLNSVNESSTVGTGISQDSSAKAGLGTGASKDKKHSEDESNKKSLEEHAGASVKIGLSGEYGGIGGEAGFKATNTDSTTITDGSSNTLSAKSSSDLSDTLTRTKNAADALAKNTTDSNTRSLAEKFSANLAKMISATDAYTKSATETESFSAMGTQSAGGGVSMSINAEKAAQKFMYESGLTDKQAAMQPELVAEKMTGFFDKLNKNFDEANSGLKAQTPELSQKMDAAQQPAPSGADTLNGVNTGNHANQSAVMNDYAGNQNKVNTEGSGLHTSDFYALSSAADTEQSKLKNQLNAEADKADQARVSSLIQSNGASDTPEGKAFTQALNNDMLTRDQAAAFIYGNMGGGFNTDGSPTDARLLQNVAQALKDTPETSNAYFHIMESNTEKGSAALSAGTQQAANDWVSGVLQDLKGNAAGNEQIFSSLQKSGDYIQSAETLLDKQGLPKTPDNIARVALAISNNRHQFEPGSLAAAQSDTTNMVNLGESQAERDEIARFMEGKGGAAYNKEHIQNLIDAKNGENPKK